MKKSVFKQYFPKQYWVTLFVILWPYICFIFVCGLIYTLTK